MSDVTAAIISKLTALEARLAALEQRETTPLSGIEAGLTMTGPLAFGAGSAASPALHVVSDTNTGIWQSAADNLDFSTGGTNRVKISSTGLGVTGSITGSTAIGARVYNSGDIELVATATWQALTFNSERFDTGSIHSTSSNTDRLTCVTPGVYLITGHAQFAANATGARALGILINGGAAIAYQRGDNAGASVTTLVSITTIYQLSAGDYVQLSAWQASGGSLNVVAAWNHSPEFGMVRIA